MGCEQEAATPMVGDYLLKTTTECAQHCGWVPLPRQAVVSHSQPPHYPTISFHAHGHQLQTLIQDRNTHSHILSDPLKASKQEANK